MKGGGGGNSLRRVSTGREISAAASQRYEASGPYSPGGRNHSSTSVVPIMLLPPVPERMEKGAVGETVATSSPRWGPAGSQRTAPTVDGPTASEQVCLVD
jgi:hypothetical protein